MYVYRQEKKIVWVFSPFPPSEQFYLLDRFHFVSFCVSGAILTTTTHYTPPPLLFSLIFLQMGFDTC